MDKAELLARIAPCPLLCHTCGGYARGAEAYWEAHKDMPHYLPYLRERE